MISKSSRTPSYNIGRAFFSTLCGYLFKVLLKQGYFFTKSIDATPQSKINP